MESGAILALFIVVAIFGPRDAAAAQAYAEKMGRWVGPLAGMVLCFFGGWIVARKATGSELLHGLLFGTLTALIDVALLIAMHAHFEPLFVVSDLAKVVAASAGGVCAFARRR